jgi:hypothetical protein
MKNKKKIGIWMDHHMAHIIKYKKNSTKSKTLESHSEGEKQNFGKDESLTQNTEQNQLSDFFKRLSTIIRGYPEVLLFGPTNAKTEFHNVLKEDNHFNNIKIETETTDNLTENQMHAFVKKHFEK